MQVHRPRPALEDGRESAQRCPVCRGAGGTGITAEVYGKLCGLAEVATHADASDDDVLKARQNLASVFRKAADRPEKQAAIGRHAAQRMTASPGETKGILLVGTIDRKEQLGAYHATRLVLMGEPSPVVVLSGAPVPFSPGERAIIAGSVISDPTIELPGYAGPRGPAVWGGMPLRLGRVGWDQLAQRAQAHQCGRPPAFGGPAAADAALSHPTRSVQARRNVPTATFIAERDLLYGQDA